MKRVFGIIRKRPGRLLASLVALTLTAMLADAWRGFGKLRPERERQRTMAGSKQWRDGVFGNPQPLQNDIGRAIAGALHADPNTQPTSQIPFTARSRADYEHAPASGLAVTWLGHSTLLIEIDGFRLLTDPNWSDRTGPASWAGPTWTHPPPLALEDLPAIDAVLTSHDHYDHLDMRSIEKLRSTRTRFIVPLGIGAHLEYWGVAAAQITEADWWDHIQVAGQVAGLDIVMTPARHAAGRALLDNDSKLWAGYAILGPRHRVFFSGDTGLFPALKEVGSKFGPFDLTMIEIGQYHQAWPDWHIGPEQAVRAHQWLQGKAMLPIHWATFSLAYHGWTEPIERTVVAAEREHVTLATPKPGEHFEPEVLLPKERWWPNLPWKNAEQDPIVSSQAE
jgi:L-ascorbate metabolism protein UlaG (beta-lactamase superfamily)